MSIVPVVGDREILDIENNDLYIRVDNAAISLMNKFKKKTPLSLTYPGMVDGKEYIIATVNLPEGTPVHNIPDEFENFPVLIDYGIIKPSTHA